LEFRPQFAPNDANYSRDRPLVKWGLGNSLHSSNPKPLMFALGQKQTSEEVRPMSVLPPKADIGTQLRDVRFVPRADIARGLLRVLSDQIAPRHYVVFRN